MLDIIIYSDNITTIKESNKAINMALVNYEIEYNIYVINKESNKDFNNIVNSNNKKIYIIDVFDRFNYDIAKMIREKNLTSMIILVNVMNKDYNILINKRLMALDFIIDSDNYIVRLKDDVNLSLKILYGDDTFIFKYNHMVYRIPYIDINYIEKETSIKRCIIHTYDKDYYIVSSIEKIMNELNDSFVRTHQSCIININNVCSFDFSDNMIIFKNGDNTTLLTNKMKKSLKQSIKI